MRAAVCSDVHGNVLAMEAVLADAADAGVDQVWVVGDLVAPGPGPAETVRLLRSLPHARFVRGNTDRYVVTGDLPEMIPTFETARSPAEVKLLVDASSSFAWTRGVVTAAEGYDWLASLPVEERLVLPDGTRVLLVHASPGHDDGRGVHESMTDRELLEGGFAGVDADLVFVGHTHVPLDRTLGDVRIVNLGSVSRPATPDRRAKWTRLIADESGFSVQRRFVEYDILAVARQLDAHHHPSAAWLRANLLGPQD